MSPSADSTDAGLSPNRAGTDHELRRRFRAFGLEYDVGVRISELAGEEMEPVSTLLLAGAQRLGGPGAGHGTGAPAPEGVDRWESEGGSVT